MAASRMSRRAGGRRLALSLLAATLLASVLSTAIADGFTSESVEDAELITVPRTGAEYVGFSGPDGEAGVGASPHDLKKHTSNKKFQKFYPKTEADWNFKGEVKKGDVFIKDAKDNRLLRLISEGLIGPQDILPIVSNDAISSSQTNFSNGEMSVTVQPEGMSGVVDDGLAADSDEKIILEKKKNATKEWPSVRVETDVSKESDENVKINLDGNAGVQSPIFNRQKGSITVPAQKQISLSKGKENQAHTKVNDASYEVISLNKQKDKQSIDEGVFDFVDSPLSNKNLVPAGTAQTSRINVKKGPNGQDYEYEYIYYYYEDMDDTTTKNGDKSRKGNEISASTASPTSRTTTPGSRNTFTSTTRYTKPFADDGLGTRIKSTDLLNEPAPSPPSPSRDRHRPDFRYTVDNSAILSASPTAPNKHVASNEVYWQYDNNNRIPGRQVLPQTVSEQTVSTVEETIPTTRQTSRGRVHFNTATTEDDSSFIVTAQPVSTQQPREAQTRSKSATGSARQPGLELVDSNSFRTHSTSIPSDYDKVYSPTQAFESARGKSLKQNSQESTVPQNAVPSASSTNTDTFRKDITLEYITGTERLQSTTPTRGASSLATETGLDNTAPFSTLSENTLTTVYGAGLTDKAAHDLYAIYQQTQNEETVKNTIAQDDRTTAVDEPESSFILTNPPTTSVFTTTTTTTTTTTAPTTTTTTAAPVPSPLPGRGRFRGNVGTRTRHSTTTTETNVAVSPADATSETSERPRSKFRPSHHREPGQRVSAYGRRGHTSTTSSSSDGEAASSTASNLDSTRPSYSATSRSRFRGGGSLRSENANTESQPSSTPSQHKFNFADRYNSRRRSGSRPASTTAAPAIASEDEETTSKSSDTSSVDNNVPEPQQSTTFRSIRNKLNPNSQVRPLRPGPKLNFSSRGRLGATSSTSTAAVPLDADTSGSADVPVEQRHTEENSEHEAEEAPNESGLSSTQLTTTSTAHPDALTRLRNRPKLRISDKGGHAKAQAQQSNITASVNHNRRQLVNNLLPRRKQPSTSTETQEVTEEKSEISPKPVTEEVIEEAQAAPKADTDVSELQPTSDATSTTESKLSSLIASRRRNLARKPGTLVHSNRQTANEESS